MSRAVRRVPMDWKHPMMWSPIWDTNMHAVQAKYVFKPLLNRRYEDDLAYFKKSPEDFDFTEPDPNDYMPDFGSDPLDRLGYCMYEETSEGTPISPVFETVEKLASWLAKNNASAFGNNTATYEQWLDTCRRGWAPSLIFDEQGLRSGVER